MRNKFLFFACARALALPLAACNDQSTVAAGQDFGPAPTLVAPKVSFIPPSMLRKPQAGRPAPGRPPPPA